MKLFFSIMVGFVSLLPDDWIRSLAKGLFVRSQAIWLKAAQNIQQAQLEVLTKIIERNQDTAFGRAYGFGQMTSLDHYKSRVPLQSWDDVMPWVNRMLQGEERVLVSEPVSFFATTSGTTGRRKLIPITPSFVEEFRVSRRFWMRTLLLTMPGMLRGKILSMQSPQTEELPGGIRAGSITRGLSGGVEESERFMDAVPAEVFRIRDFKARYFLCMRFALCEEVSLVAAINPSTLGLFIKTFQNHHEALAKVIEEGRLGVSLKDNRHLEEYLESLCFPRPDVATLIRESAAKNGGTPLLKDMWEDLAGVCCWKGGTGSWYLPKITKHFGKVPILDYGYAASEGGFGAPVDAEGADSVLMPHGLFFEFMPEEEIDEIRAGEKDTHLLHQLRPGKKYNVVISNQGGLYRYDMNDIVQVTGFYDNVPMVRFCHKGGTMSSVTGEKMGESHVVQAMDQTLSHVGGQVDGFVVSPLWPDPEEEEAVPRYLLAAHVAQRLIHGLYHVAFAHFFARH
ncbi:MAG: hypothetical protein CMH56_13855 [Myxococcales bacterium]|nr:hypothetical protein [Myxococcales bacterium]